MNKFFAFILLIFLLPLMLIVFILILIDSGFPIFFIQKRVGLKNKYFWIYKFRTMKKNTPDIPTHLMEKNKDVYTIIGPFLRKLSLDEIPQLINILRGEMVFIGPRPALYNQSDLIKSRTAKGIEKLMPGITGWAQINGRDNLTIEQKVNLDHYYLQNKSLFLDIRIILLTIIKVFRTDDISN